MNAPRMFGLLLSLLKHPLIVLAFVIPLVFLASRGDAHSPYGYDEADYMYVANLGFVPNYTDTPTMPITEFIRTGLSRGLVSRPVQLSQLIRGSNDVVFYRHWHGPLYFYSLVLVSRFGLDEHWMRLSTLTFAICSLLLIYVCVIWIFGGIQGTLAALLGSALFVWSATTVRSVELAPHQAFVCSSLASLFLLSKTVATGNRRYFYWAVIAAALCCCLLEVGFVVAATCAVCAYAERQKLCPDRTLAVRSACAFATTMLVVWPGAIIKLSLVKGYLFMAYLALFRKSPWGTDGFFETWEKRIFNSPLEWLVIGATLFSWRFLRWPESNKSVLYPFLVYATMMLAATLRVTTGTPRYSLVFEPALDVLAGCILAAQLTRVRRPMLVYAAVLTLSLALFGETWANVRRQPGLSDPRLPSLLAFIRDNHLERSRVFVPQADLPTLHYYFPRSQLQGYTELQPELSAALDPGVDGILYPGLPIRYQRISARDFNWGRAETESGKGR